MDYKKMVTEYEKLNGDELMVMFTNKIEDLKYRLLEAINDRLDKEVTYTSEQFGTLSYNDFIGWNNSEPDIENILVFDKDENKWYVRTESAYHTDELYYEPMSLVNIELLYELFKEIKWLEMQANKSE